VGSPARVSACRACVTRAAPVKCKWRPDYDYGLGPDARECPDRRQQAWEHDLCAKCAQQPTAELQRLCTDCMAHPRIDSAVCRCERAHATRRTCPCTAPGRSQQVRPPPPAGSATASSENQTARAPCWRPHRCVTASSACSAMRLPSSASQRRGSRRATCTTTATSSTITPARGCSGALRGSPRCNARSDLRVCTV
jgi:hypothetical protein